MESPTVATYPSEGGRRGLTGASSKGGRCVESPQTFIRGKRQKNQKACGLRTLSVKGSGVVFTQGEGNSTPTRPSQGTTAFNLLNALYLELLKK